MEIEETKKEIEETNKKIKKLFKKIKIDKPLLNCNYLFYSILEEDFNNFIKSQEKQITNKVLLNNLYENIPEYLTDKLKSELEKSKTKNISFAEYEYFINCIKKEKQNYLYRYFNKMLYYDNKPEELSSLSNLEYFLPLKKEDLPTAANKPYISLFYRLQQQANILLTEYKKTYLYGKQIIKLCNKLKDILFDNNFLSELNEIELLENFINSENLLYIHFYDPLKKNFKNTKYTIEYTYIYTTKAYIDGKEIGLIDYEHNKTFKTKKEFISFKRKLKNLYNSFLKLTRILTIDNREDYIENIEYLSIIESDNMAKLPYFAGRKKPNEVIHNDNIFYYKQNKKIFLKLNNSNNFNILTVKIIKLIHNKLKENTNAVYINAEEISQNLNLKYTKDFKKRLKEELTTIGTLSFTVSNTKQYDKYDIYPMFSKISVKLPDITIIFNSEHISDLKGNGAFKNFLIHQEDKRIFALPNKDIILNQILFKMDDYYRFGKKRKYRNGKEKILYPNQQKDNNGTFSILPIKNIIKETNLLETYIYTVNNKIYIRYQEIISLLENKLNLLEEQNIIKWEYTGLIKDFNDYTAKEIYTNLKIKYYIITQFKHEKQSP